MGDIKFNEENKVKAMVACIPLVGLILLFVEKEDQFVRYYGGMYTVIGIIGMILGIIPCLNAIVGIAIFILIIVGAVKASQGEKFELPLASEYGIKLMNAIK